MKVLIVLSLLVAVALAETCWDGETSKKVDNVMCPWYNDNSCCAQEEEYTGSVSVEVSEVSGPTCEFSKKCQAQLEFMSCADCSPLNAEFTTGGVLNKTVAICKGFAEDAYDACKDSETMTADGSCKTLGDTFANAEEFVTGLKFYFGLVDKVVIVDGEENCFNAAGLIQPVVALIVACFAALQF